MERRSKEEKAPQQPIVKGKVPSVRENQQPGRNRVEQVFTPSSEGIYKMPNPYAAMELSPKRDSLHSESRDRQREKQILVEDRQRSLVNSMDSGDSATKSQKTKPTPSILTEAELNAIDKVFLKQMKKPPSILLGFSELHLTLGLTASDKKMSRVKRLQKFHQKLIFDGQILLRIPLPNESDHIDEQGGQSPMSANVKSDTIIKKTVTTDEGALNQSNRIQEVFDSQNTLTGANQTYTQTIQQDGGILESPRIPNTNDQSTFSKRANSEHDDQILSQFNTQVVNDYSMTIQSSKSTNKNTFKSNRILVESISSDKRRVIIASEVSQESIQVMKGSPRAQKADYPSATKPEIKKPLQEKKMLTSKQPAKTFKKQPVVSKPDKKPISSARVNGTSPTRKEVRSPVSPISPARKPVKTPPVVAPKKEVTPKKETIVKPLRNQIVQKSNQDASKKAVTPSKPDKPSTAQTMGITKPVPRVFNKSRSPDPQVAKDAEKVKVPIPKVAEKRGKPAMPWLQKKKKQTTEATVKPEKESTIERSANSPPIGQSRLKKRDARESQLKSDSSPINIKSQDEECRDDSIEDLRSPRRKQAPPRRPTFKRFKTQTKERGFQAQSNNPDLQVSSMDESSNSQAFRMGQNSSQNKAFLVYSSVNDEFAKVSDAGLQELSIVESENMEGETPAAHFKRNSFRKDFNDYIKPDNLRASHDSRDSKSQTNISKTKAASPASKGRVSPIRVEKQKSTKQKKDTIKHWPIPPNTLLAKLQNSEGSQPAKRRGESQGAKPGLNGVNAINRRQRVNYLSSNESMILAQSKNNPNVTLSLIRTKEKNQMNIENNNNRSMTNKSPPHKNTSIDSKSSQKRRHLNILENLNKQGLASEKSIKNNVEAIRTKHYLQNMPIKGNLKIKPQRSYHFVDSDFDNNLSIRTPNHWNQGSYTKSNRSPSLSRQEASTVSQSSRKFAMYERKFNNRSKENRDQNRSKTRSKDRKEQTNPNSTDEGSKDGGYFTAERHSRAQKKNEMKELSKDIERQQEKTVSMMQQSQQRALNRMQLAQQTIELQQRDQAMRDQVAVEVRRSKELHHRNMQNNNYGEAELPQNLKTLKRIQDQLERNCHLRGSKDNKSSFKTSPSRHKTQRQRKRLIDSQDEFTVNYKTQSVHFDGYELGESQGQGPNSAQGQAQMSIHEVSLPLEQERGTDQERGNGNNISAERGDDAHIATADERLLSNIVIKDENLPRSQVNSRRMRTRATHSIGYKHPFKIPKYTVPRQWHQVLERQYDMVVTDEHSPAVFLQGKTQVKQIEKSSRDMKMRHIPTSDDEQLKKPSTAGGYSIEERHSNVDEMEEQLLQQSFNDRKKSRELAFLRSQQRTAEDRLRKLSEMPVSRRTAHQRELKDLQYQIDRNEAKNILGSEQVPSCLPNTTRANRRKFQSNVTANRRNYGELLQNSKRQANVFSFIKQDGIHRENLAHINGLLSEISNVKTQNSKNVNFSTNNVNYLTRDSHFSGNEIDQRSNQHKTNTQLMNRNAPNLSDFETFILPKNETPAMKTESNIAPQRLRFSESGRNIMAPQSPAIQNQ